MDASAPPPGSFDPDPPSGSDANLQSEEAAQSHALRHGRCTIRVVPDLSRDTPTSEAEIRLVMAYLGAKIADILADDP